MKTKFKVRIVALTAALLMLLSAFCSFGIVAAHASYVSDEEMADYVFPELTPDEELNLDTNFTSLYYFSDYSESEEYYNNGFIGQYIRQNPYLESSEMHYWGYPNTILGFWDEMNSYYFSEGYLIENALIIFEVRNSNELQFVENETQIPDYWNTKFGYMEQLFSTWKNQGCKIAFIDGLDEIRYELTGFNEFLQYVDIHINIDHVTTYGYSIVDELTNSFTELLDRQIVIFDDALPEKWSIYQLLVTYFVMMADPYLTIYEGENLFDALAISVYFYNRNNNRYYVYEQDQNGINREQTVTVEWEAMREILEDSNRISVIGNSLTLLDENLDDNINELAKEIQHFTVEYPQNTYNYCLSVIMKDFILNNDDSLWKYNNRTGRCDITFIPLFYSSDGWLKVPKTVDWLNMYFSTENMQEGEKDRLLKKLLHWIFV